MGILKIGLLYFFKRPFEQAFHFFGSALQIAEEKITPSKLTSNCDNNKKLKQVVFMRMIWKRIIGKEPRGVITMF